SIRRRHTSSYGDWSSDVCSSDLTRRFRRLHTGYPRGLHGGQSFFARMHAICAKGLPPGPPPKNLRDLSFIKPVEVVETVGGRNRSEERRVGKGGTTRVTRQL